MSLFHPKKTAQQYQKESNKIVSVFIDTVKQLKEQNNEIEKEISHKEEEITKLQTDVTILSSVITKNKNFSDKVESFFSES